MSCTHRPRKPRVWCIGWAGRCPEYGGNFHGCLKPPKHPGDHVCYCGATHPRELDTESEPE